MLFLDYSDVLQLGLRSFGRLLSIQVLGAAIRFLLSRPEKRIPLFL
jgi:hypothetical protein